jgi:hypothetical protein
MIENLQKISIEAAVNVIDPTCFTTSRVTGIVRISAELSNVTSWTLKKKKNANSTKSYLRLKTRHGFD